MYAESNISRGQKMYADDILSVRQKTRTIAEVMDPTGHATPVNLVQSHYSDMAPDMFDCGCMDFEMWGDCIHVGAVGAYQDETLCR